jgi:transposase
MKCPKCGEEDCVKNGKIGERQRYRCKKCGRNYTKDTNFHSTHRSVRTKRKAIIYYIQGKSFRDISKQLKVSNAGIEYWLKELKDKILNLEAVFSKKYYSKSVRKNLTEARKIIMSNKWDGHPYLNIRKLDEYAEDLRQLID